MNRLAWVLATITLACGAQNARPAAPPEPAGDKTPSAEARTSDAKVAPSASASSAAAPVSTTLSPALNAPGPSLTFTEIRGMTAEQTGTLFAPTLQAIEDCKKSDGGKLVVKLRTERGKIVPEIIGGASLEPLAKRCVLESLSTPHLEDTPNVNAGPMTKPSGFTSVLTIEW